MLAGDDGIGETLREFTRNVVSREGGLVPKQLTSQKICNARGRLRELAKHTGHLPIEVHLMAAGIGNFELLDMKGGSAQPDESRPNLSFETYFAGHGRDRHPQGAIACVTASRRRTSEEQCTRAVKTLLSREFPHKEAPNAVETTGRGYSLFGTLWPFCHIHNDSRSSSQ